MTSRPGWMNEAGGRLLQPRRRLLVTWDCGGLPGDRRIVEHRHPWRQGVGGTTRAPAHGAEVLEDLRRLVEPATLGDPMRPPLWVSKSREKHTAALRGLNHAISANTVGRMLTTLGYSRQANRKTKEGSHHPDRDGEFQDIIAGPARDDPAKSRASGGWGHGPKPRFLENHAGSHCK